MLTQVDSDGMSTTVMEAIVITEGMKPRHSNTKTTMSKPRMEGITSGRQQKAERDTH